MIDDLSCTSLPTLKARHDCSAVVHVFKILVSLSLLLQMSLFHTLVLIRDVAIPVRSTSPLVTLRSVKEASFILGLNFGISCLKMLHLVSLCLPSRLLSRLSSWTSCLLCYLGCLFIWSLSLFV